MIYRFLSTLLFSSLIFFYTYPVIPQFPAAQNLPPDFPQMSEKDLHEMVNFLDGLSDQELKELEDLGRQVLTDMGYDAETLEPLNPNTPSLKDLYAAQPTPVVETPTTPTAPLVVETIVNTEELEEYFTKFLKHLHTTQQKAQSPILADRKLSRWIPELRDINFYVTVIAHSEHLKRLLTPEFETMLKHIKELGLALITYEPLVRIQEPVYEVTDDSYEILGITPSASQEDIEEAYEKIKKQKSPDAIKEKLTKEGLVEKDIKRATKEAQLTMSIITDAYEKLQDPKTREQVDRERLAHTQQQGSLEKGSQKALDSLTNAISTAIYTHQLIDELEQFLKKYEPAQLEQKKALEKAEEDRKKEQLEAAKKKVTPTPGGQLEAAPRASSASNAGYDNYGGYGYPAYDYGNQYYPDYAGMSQPGSLGAGSPTAGKAGKSGAKDGKKDGGKKDGKDKESGSDGKKDEKGKQEKSSADELKDLFKTITDPMNKIYDRFTVNATGEEIRGLITKEVHEKAEKIDEALKEFTSKIKKAESKVKKEYESKWKLMLKNHAEKKNQENKNLNAYYDEVAQEIAKKQQEEQAKKLKAVADLGPTPEEAKAALEPEEKKKSLLNVLQRKAKLDAILGPKKVK